MSHVNQLAIPLDRDRFLRSLLGELASVLEETVGTEEAAGYVSLVGAALGRQIEAHYRDAGGVETLDRNTVEQVLVDLKRRIGGGFSIDSVEEDRIVLVNTHCPFGDMVIGRPSLCMMTSNVFGHITANNLGYARVDIDRAIARGDGGCRVVVHLRPANDHEPRVGREYLGPRTVSAE